MLINLAVAYGEGNLSYSDLCPLYLERQHGEFSTPSSFFPIVSLCGSGPGLRVMSVLR